ncbi:hypothetical protein S83_024993, partial [Arachis hypogaea]
SGKVDIVRRSLLAVSASPPRSVAGRRCFLSLELGLTAQLGALVLPSSSTETMHGMISGFSGLGLSLELLLLL